MQNVDCHALAEFDEPEKQVLGADVVVVEAIGFLPGKRQNLLSPRCEIIHRWRVLLPDSSPILRPVY